VSNPPAESPKPVARQLADLQRKLREQVDLLEVESATFDAGNPVMARPLAVCVRVLVHDTSASAALLQQLGMLDTILFADTALHVDPNNLLPTPGLTIVRMTGGQGADWVAPLDMLTPSRIRPPIRFEPWWTTAVINDRMGHAWSGRDLVLFLANKEGGAHVDPRAPNEAIRALEEDNSIGWMFSDPIAGEGVPMLNGPIPPSVRQIAHELHLTLAPFVTESAESTGS
jgi:hypothetical protein